MASSKTYNPLRPLLLCLAKNKDDIKHTLIPAIDAKSAIWHLPRAYEAYFRNNAEWAKTFVDFKLRVPTATPGRCTLVQNMRSMSYMLKELNIVYDTINDLTPAGAPYLIAFVVAGDAAGATFAGVMDELEPEFSKWRALYRPIPDPSPAARYYVAERDRELADALAFDALSRKALAVPGVASTDAWMLSMIRAARAAEPGPLRVLLDKASRDACIAVGFNALLATDTGAMPMMLAAGGPAGTLKSSIPDDMRVYLLTIPL